MSSIVEKTLLDLSWDDILFQYIFPYLSLKDCFSLRATSKSYKELVEDYFKVMKKLNITSYKKMNASAFKVSHWKIKFLLIMKLSAVDDGQHLFARVREYKKGVFLHNWIKYFFKNLNNLTSDFALKCRKSLTRDAGVWSCYREKTPVD